MPTEDELVAEIGAQRLRADRWKRAAVWMRGGRMKARAWKAYARHLYRYRVEAQAHIEKQDARIAQLEARAAEIRVCRVTDL
jgi:hypothetical protein